MDQKSQDFLARYLNNPSPTGFESQGQKIWMDYLRPYVDEFITDTYGNAVAVVNPGSDYTVVLAAHADEISWFVSHITADGFIYVKRNGGSDHMIAPSKRVTIYGDNGPVKGLFGWPAIHTRTKSREETPKLTNIFIDIGALNEAEVRAMGIHTGSVVLFDEEFHVLNDRYYTGRALDNRLGGFMIAEVARRLHEARQRPDFTLCIVNSVQEEVGLRGAAMIAERLRPDVALITDVTHDTSTPMVDKFEHGDIRCARGPVLMIGPAVHNKLLQHIVQVTKDKGIAFQYNAASRSTGTDTDSFAYSHTGVASALVS
ncbi:MAG TPA: M42 family peptidase, partial [Bacteroidia bacterium]|nr:M42 family peptidase [Bacteroidia bacterium]